MIPQFGRILPFIVSALGIVDIKYTWDSNRILSIFLGLITLYLIHFMFKDHASVSPKKALFHITVPFVLMVVIVGASWFIFF